MLNLLLLLGLGETHIFVVSKWNALKKSLVWRNGEIKPLGALVIALRCFVWRRD